MPRESLQKATIVSPHFFEDNKQCNITVTLYDVVTQVRVIHNLNMTARGTVLHRQIFLDLASVASMCSVYSMLLSTM